MSKVRALTEQGKTLREVLELTKKCKKICQQVEKFIVQTIASLVVFVQESLITWISMLRYFVSDMRCLPFAPHSQAFCSISCFG